MTAQQNDLPKPAINAARRIAQLMAEIQSSGMVRLTIIKVDGVHWLAVDDESRMERLGK